MSSAAYWAEHAKRLGSWELREGSGEVWRNGARVARLSGNEEEVFRCLMDAYPVPLRAAALETQVILGKGDVKVYILHIRSKLGRESIITQGRGYILHVEEE